MASTIAEAIRVYKSQGLVLIELWLYTEEQLEAVQEATKVHVTMANC